MHSAEDYSTATRVQLLVRGLVQGVGFRPYVFSLAMRRALKGRVLNNTTGVLIDVEGEGEAIERFISEIQSNPPPLSSIESIERTNSLDGSVAKNILGHTRIVDRSPLCGDLEEARNELRLPHRITPG